MSADTVAIIAVGVALLGVLVPLQLALATRTDRRIDRLGERIGAVRDDLHALGERVARIEGALSGPYRLPAEPVEASP
ncbi:MAG: hypothetical protein OXC09_10080 [Truepera sp.]|nr:hypothetical protein [Truepera sp.]